MSCEISDIETTGTMRVKVPTWSNVEAAEAMIWLLRDEESIGLVYGSVKCGP